MIVQPALNDENLLIWEWRYDLGRQQHYMSPASNRLILKNVYFDYWYGYFPLAPGVILGISGQVKFEYLGRIHTEISNWRVISDELAGCEKNDYCEGLPHDL